MQNDVAKAIATFEDRHKAEACPKVEALARDLGYSLPNLSTRDEILPCIGSGEIPAP